MTELIHVRHVQADSRTPGRTGSASAPPRKRPRPAVGIAHFRELRDDLMRWASPPEAWGSAAERE